jgi:3-dehydrosphinganine reductase
MARSLTKLEEAKNSVKNATGVEVAIYAADVRDYDAVKKAVDEAGPIDVLLLNHGVFYALELEKMELSEVKFTLDVNLMGCLNMIKAVLPEMKNRKDPLPVSIAFVSSQAGQVFHWKLDCICLKFYCFCFLYLCMCGFAVRKIDFE